MSCETYLPLESARRPTEGPDGAPGDFEVRYTFGHHPLQQYLLAVPRGRLQALDVAWDSENKRWFHLLPDLDPAPGDDLHWYSADVDYRLTRLWVLLLSLERTEGESERSRQIFVTGLYRF